MIARTECRAYFRTYFVIESGLDDEGVVGSRGMMIYVSNDAECRQARGTEETVERGGRATTPGGNGGQVSG